MRHLVKKTGFLLAAVMILMLQAVMSAAASDDNSLYDLGIKTEGAEIEPAFQYDIWSYEVTVPGGTTELALEPVPSSSEASISSITGTTLDAEGNGTVYITVKAGSGSEFTYTLNVKTDSDFIPVAEPVTEAQTQAAAAPAPTPQTEAQTQAPQTEPQTEDSRFVRVDKNTIQEAENTITGLKDEITTYRDTISLYTKIMYGLIGLSVVLLFILINVILRKKDLKAELKEYRSLGYGRNDKNTSGNAGGAAEWQGGPAASRGQSIDNRVSPAQYYAPTGNLDVMPQTSQGRGRKLPEYEKAPQQGGPQGAPQGAGQAPQQGRPQGAPQGTAGQQPARPMPQPAQTAAAQGAAQQPAGQTPQQKAPAQGKAQQPQQAPASGAASSPQQETPSQGKTQQPQQNQNAPAAPPAGQTGREARQPERSTVSAKDVEIDMIDL